MQVDTPAKLRKRFKRDFMEKTYLPDSDRKNVFDFLLRSFQYRNYRLFFFGQGISLIGTWMQNIAMSWLVYSLTKSALMLGLVGFAGQIPSFLFTPFAGVLADRYHRKSILIVTQTLSLIQAFALALLVISGKISVMFIIPLSIFLGLVNALDMPTRQSFVVDMIENKEDLGNAIVLNSSMFNSARLLGPSIAGILILAVGVGACFLINGFIGFLMGFSGLGALLGAGFLASKENTRGLLRLIPIASSIFGLGLIAFSQSRILWLSYFLMMVTGLGMVMQMASCNTVIQTVVADDKRGRVMSFYNMAFMGMMPLGSLLAGSLANTLGAPKTILVGGVACIFGALTFAYKTSSLREAHKNV